jgi:hypothetical protein
MPLLFKTGGTYKSSSTLYAKVGGAWKPAKKGFIKAGGTWYPFYVQAINDDWNRAVSTGLGTDLSGDAWTILRGTWSVINGVAREKSGKDAVPLGVIELGLLNVQGRINQLQPGMGMALRVADQNNFWGIVPYYTQTATPYTYCAVAGTPYSQCISSHQSGTGTSCPGGYVNQTVPGGCIDVNYVYDCLDWGRNCVITPNCTTTPANCYYWGCCLHCDTASTTCGAPTVECYNTCPGGFGLVEAGCNQYGPSTVVQTCPTGEVSYPTYTCDQSVLITPCNSYATGYTYTNYYYVRLFKMVAGVMSVVGDYPVTTAWTALKVTTDNNTFNIQAFSDDAYATKVLDTTFTLAGTPTSAASEPAGTAYGIVGIASSYNDGATVGPIYVGAVGQ